MKNTVRIELGMLAGYSAELAKGLVRAQEKKDRWQQILTRLLYENQRHCLVQGRRINNFVDVLHVINDLEVLPHLVAPINEAKMMVAYHELEVQSILAGKVIVDEALKEESTRINSFN